MTIARLNREGYVTHHSISYDAPVGYTMDFSEYDTPIHMTQISKGPLSWWEITDDITATCSECDEELMGRQLIDRLEFGRLVGISLADRGLCSACDFCVLGVLHMAFSLVWKEALESGIYDETYAWYLKQAKALT